MLMIKTYYISQQEGCLPYDLARPSVCSEVFQRFQTDPEVSKILKSFRP